MATRLVALVMVAVLVAATHQAWAAAQPAASIQPIPVEATLGPGQDKEGGNTTLLTYNCTGGIQVTLPQDLTGGAATIVIVLYNGVEEHKVKCQLSLEARGNITQDVAGVQGAPEAGSGKSQIATATPQILTVDSTQEATTSANPSTAEAPAITQVTQPQAEEETTETRLAGTSPQPSPEAGGSQASASLQTGSGERLMITLVGGIIAGLAALAVWRILLS